MKRLAVALALLAVLPPGARAQDETVTVATMALQGVWEITGAPNNNFCRIQNDDDAMSGYCTMFGSEKGSVAVEEGRLHMAFGSMALRLVIDGPMQSATRFTARFSAKMFGVPHEMPAALTGRKLILSETAPDAGGKAELLRHLLEEMRLGKPPEIFASTDATPIGLLTPAVLHTLGDTVAVIPLGSLFTGAKGSVRAQAYAVEFANGERICALNQRDDGVLDRFFCS